MPTGGPTTQTPRTGLAEAFTQRGAGTDYVIETGLDDKFRAWKRGDAFPRMVFDFLNGDILVGNGTVPPVSIIGNVGPGGNGLPVYDIVTAYHADPTGVSDAASPINQAISDANAAGGGIVFAPIGHYSIASADVVMLAGVTLLGESRAGVFFVDNRSSGSTIRIRGTDAATVVQRCHVEWITVTGNNPGTNARIGIELKWAQLCVVTENDIQNSGIGVSSYGAASCAIDHNAFAACGTTNGTGWAGVYVFDDANGHSDSIHVDENLFEGCFEHDVVVAGSVTTFRPEAIAVTGNTFHGTHIRGNRVDVRFAQGCRVSGNLFYATSFDSGYTTPAALVYVSGCAGMVVHDNEFAVTGTVAASCVDVDATSIETEDVTVMSNKVVATATVAVAFFYWHNTAPHYNLRGTDIDNDVIANTANATVRNGFPNTISRTQMHGVMNAREYGCIGDNNAYDGPALQAFLTAMRVEGRHGRIPAGTYLTQSDASTFTPLIMDFAVGPAGQTILEGDGDGRTTFATNVDPGVDGFGNPIAHIRFERCGQDNSIEMTRLNFQGNMTHTSSNFSPNNTAIPLSKGIGFDVPNRCYIHKISARGYYAGGCVDGISPDGTTVRGTDHHIVSDLTIEECRLAFYVRRNNGLPSGGGTKTVDFYYSNWSFGRCQWGGFVVADDGYARDILWSKVHIANLPHGFLKEGVDGITPTEQVFMADCMMAHVKCEGCGQYAILDQSGLAIIHNISGHFELHGIEINNQKTHKALTTVDHTWRPWTGTATRLLGEMTVSNVPAGLLERAFTGTVTHGSASITACVPTPTSGDVGLPINGAAIRAGTTVSAVSGTTITLSQPALNVGAFGTNTPFVVGFGIGVGDHLATGATDDVTFVDCAIITQIIDPTTMKAKAGGQSATLALLPFASGSGMTGGTPIRVDPTSPNNVRAQHIGMSVFVSTVFLGIIDTVNFFAQTFTLVAPAPYGEAAAINGDLVLPDVASPVNITYGKVGGMRIGQLVNVGAWNIHTLEDPTTANIRSALWWDFGQLLNVRIYLSNDDDLGFPAIDVRYGGDFKMNTKIIRGDMECTVRAARGSFKRGQTLQSSGSGVKLKAHATQVPYMGTARGADGALAVSVNADLSTARPYVLVQDRGDNFVTVFNSEGGGLYCTSVVVQDQWLYLSQVTDGITEPWDGTTTGLMVVAKSHGLAALDVASNYRVDCELVPAFIT